MKIFCFNRRKCNSYEISAKVDNDEDQDHDVISKITGHIGAWNLLWVSIISLLQVNFGLQTFAFPFQSVSQDFWCTNDDMSSRNASLNSCQNCSEFEFSHDIYESTMIEDFNLICDRKSLIATVETCGILGTVFASVLSGWMSDKYGRKPILMMSLFLQISLGTLLAFSNSLPMLMILRTIVGFSTSSVFIINDVLVMELVSPKYRSAVGIANMMLICLGNAILAGVAYYETNWRKLQLIITVPWTLFLLAWYCIPESPRWLLAMEKYDQLINVLQRMAKCNRKSLPPNLKQILEKEPKEIDENNVNLFKEVFRKQYIWKTILTLLIFFTMGGIYVILSLHLVGLGGNIYLNVAISAFSEMFVTAIIIFVSLRLNIGPVLIFCMFACGLCLLAVNIVQVENGVIALAIAARCLSGAGNNVINSYAAKIFPTHIRNFAIGLGYFALGISGIITPYIWLLEHFYKFLPLSIMGLYGILAAILISIMERIEKKTIKS